MNSNEKEVRSILGSLTRTHWGRRIVAAVKRGRFLGQDVKDSMEWVTCACGKIHYKTRFKLDNNGQHMRPADEQLVQHGASFCGKVCGGRFATAARDLVQIEYRAKELCDV